MRSTSPLSSLPVGLHPKKKQNKLQGWFAKPVSEHSNRYRTETKLQTPTYEIRMQTFPDESELVLVRPRKIALMTL